ncbi:hypothetical protein FRC03_003562, partial [Tulasnella sp. 419]
MENALQLCTWTVAVLSLLILDSDTVADVVTVGARNRAISYQNASTWTLLPPSRGSCGRYQMVTKQIGDYAAFEFEGDSIAVFGGVGVYGGIIEIDLDGVANHTYGACSTHTVALHWFRTKRRQKSFQRPTDDLSYDLSGLLVLSKTQ